MREGDTTTQRLQLAVLVRELEKKLEQNRQAIGQPWIAHPDHVRAYFEAYKDYLGRALAFPELPNHELFEQRKSTPIFIHRDNIPSLAGRIGELAAALEASALDVTKELESLRGEVVHLRADVQRLTSENAELRKAASAPRFIGGQPENG